MQIKIPEIYIPHTGEVLIHGTEMTIPAKGIILVKGKNGSGKTTLVKKIFGSHPGLFSMLCQENDLILPELSVLDNIDMFQGNKAKIQTFLEENQLVSLLTKPAKSLSGGETRLVAVLRTLFSPRSYIILDEPSNDIDYRIFEILFQLIKKFSLCKAIIIVSHDDRFVGVEQVYEIVNQELIQRQTFVQDFGKEDIKKKLSY